MSDIAAAGAPRPVPVVTGDTDRSYVDWPAIIAGAFLAIAIGFVLNAFGAGLGLTMAGSPWEEGMSAGWFLAAAAIWYIWVQVSSVMAGGYLAGRLRRRLYDADEDEVDIRDAAHGLLVWAVGTVVGVALLAGALAAGVSAAGKIAGGAASGALSVTASATTPGEFDYMVERLFRPVEPGEPAAGTVSSSQTASSGTAENENVPAPLTDSSDLVPAPATPEAANIARNDVVGILQAAGNRNELAVEDRDYIARLVADNTGLSLEEAEERVDNYLLRALDELRDTAEAARRTGIFIAFVTAATLLVSAIGGWWAAGVGGRHRDQGIYLTRWLRVR